MFGQGWTVKACGECNNCVFSMLQSFGSFVPTTSSNLFFALTAFSLIKILKLPQSPSICFVWCKHWRPKQINKGCWLTDKDLETPTIAKHLFCLVQTLETKTDQQRLLAHSASTISTVSTTKHGHRMSRELRPNLEQRLSTCCQPVNPVKGLWQKAARK